VVDGASARTSYLRPLVYPPKMSEWAEEERIAQIDGCAIAGGKLDKIASKLN
jgi:hypothetical protein